MSDPRDIERINPDNTPVNSNTNSALGTIEADAGEKPIGGAVIHAPEEKQQLPAKNPAQPVREPKKGGSHAA